MIEVELPDGTIAEFPDTMAPEQIQGVLRQQFGGPPAAEAALAQAQPSELDRYYSSGIFAGQYNPLGSIARSLDAATTGSQNAVSFNLADEIGGILPGTDADAQRARQNELAASNPVATIAGTIGGGLAMGGKAAQSGLTLMGRNIPVLSAAAPRTASVLAAGAEGAAYGGLYGAGGADPGERLSGAATGAAIGGLTGAALQGVGNAISTRSARKAAEQAAPAADDLKSAAQSLYRQSEAEGVTIAQPAIQRLGGNLKLAAGRINDRLRPNTAGYMDDIEAMATGNMSLEAFDEFRQSLGKSIARAQPDDARTLTSMKRLVDNFADNLKPGDFTGDAQAAVGLLKQARQTWARASKAQTIERILDSADVDGVGRYTQSGFANAVRREMRTLYKSIQKGKQAGWTKEEVALIRQMAMGGSNSRLVNLFAKFAPRGVVSIAAGQVIGSMAPGVGNVAMPMIGHVAGEVADRGAMAAAQALRTGAATGTAPYVLPQIARKTTPFIGGAAIGANSLADQLMSLPRGVR